MICSLFAPPPVCWGSFHQGPHVNDLVCSQVCNATRMFRIFWDKLAQTKHSPKLVGDETLRAFPVCLTCGPASRGLSRMLPLIKVKLKGRRIVHGSLGLHSGSLALQSNVCIQNPFEWPYCSCVLQIGVVHRDLKLENILLDEDMNVKVTML